MKRIQELDILFTQESTSCLYFAKVITNSARPNRYFIYHEIYSGGTVCVTEASSLDYVVGYLEGAIYGRLEDLKVRNGVPKKLIQKLKKDGVLDEGSVLRPIVGKEIEPYIANSALLDLYPNLHDTFIRSKGTRNN